MTNNLLGFDHHCIFCSGSGEYTAPGDTLKVECPLCLSKKRLEIAVTALDKIAEFGKDKPNQPFVRAFNQDTIAIAERAMERLTTFSARFGFSSEP